MICLFIFVSLVLLSLLIAYKGPTLAQVPLNSAKVERDETHHDLLDTFQFLGETYHNFHATYQGSASH